MEVLLSLYAYSRLSLIGIKLTQTMKIILRTSIQITFRHMPSLCTFPDYPFLIILIYSFLLMQLCRINYPFCALANHASEPLCRLCIDEKCQQKSLVCCICEYEHHQGHTTIPIKQFIYQISGNHSQPINTHQFTQELTNIKKNYFQNILDCRTTLLHKLSELQTYGQIYFNRCEQSLNDLITLQQPLSKFAQDSNPKFFQNYFKKILQIYSSQDKNGFSLKSKFSTLLGGCKEKEKRIVESINALLGESKKSMQKAEDILKESLELALSIEGLKWSQSLKGTKIKITENILQQTNNESSGQRFALTELALPNTTVRWGIKVKKFTGWVGIGICLKNIIKTANFHFNHTNIGHGSYLISTNGYCWSHSVKQSNSIYKTFQFTINDVVYLEYDPKQGKLRFRKNNGPDKFELEVGSAPSGDSYHACVNLCSTGDSVELIYPGVALS